MATLLEPPTEVVEEPIPWRDSYSATEREILVLLKRSAMYPLSLKELRNELPRFSLNLGSGKESATC